MKYTVQELAYSKCVSEPVRTSLLSMQAQLNDSLVLAAPDLLQIVQLTLAWIDAVPKETVLPTMPGFDRDWVDSVVGRAKGIL